MFLLLVMLIFNFIDDDGTLMLYSMTFQFCLLTSGLDVLVEQHLLNRLFSSLHGKSLVLLAGQVSFSYGKASIDGQVSTGTAVWNIVFVVPHSHFSQPLFL